MSGQRVLGSLPTHPNSVLSGLAPVCGWAGLKPEIWILKPLVLPWLTLAHIVIGKHSGNLLNSALIKLFERAYTSQGCHKLRLFYLSGLVFLKGQRNLSFSGCGCMHVAACMASTPEPEAPVITAFSLWPFCLPAVSAAQEFLWSSRAQEDEKCCLQIALRVNIENSCQLLPSNRTGSLS